MEEAHYSTWGSYRGWTCQMTWWNPFTYENALEELDRIIDARDGHALRGRKIVSRLYDVEFWTPIEGVEVKPM